MSSSPTMVKPATPYERLTTPLVRDGGVLRPATWEEAMASEFQFCPGIDQLTPDSPPPIRADDQGRYPVPVPGAWVEI